MLGAIGYAEEHEVPRHFWRVHTDLARFGGVTRARAELADHLLGPAQETMSCFLLLTWDPLSNACRKDVREWLAKIWTPERRAEHCASRSRNAAGMSSSRN